jgi:hypothetical protein
MRKVAEAEDMTEAEVMKNTKVMEVMKEDASVVSHKYLYSMA